MVAFQKLRNWWATRPSVLSAMRRKIKASQSYAAVSILPPENFVESSAAEENCIGADKPSVSRGMAVFEANTMGQFSKCAMSCLSWRQRVWVRSGIRREDLRGKLESVKPTEERLGEVPRPGTSGRPFSFYAAPSWNEIADRARADANAINSAEIRDAEIGIKNCEEPELEDYIVDVERGII